MYLNNNDLAHYEDMFLYQCIPVFIALGRYGPHARCSDKANEF